MDIILPQDRTAGVLRELDALDGVLGVRLTPGASLRPAGDVVTVLATNVALHEVLRALDRLGIPRHEGASITLSEPAGVLSATAGPAVSGDSTEIPWEEMEYTIARESNMGHNGLLTMAAAGVFAAIGLATNALHLVIAGMLIAPGFEPIVRMALGFVSRASVWRRGMKDFALGYAALLAGAIGASIVLMAMGRPLPAAEASYLHLGELPKYWTTFTGPSVLISAVAGFAGAVLIANNRSVLTAGVMIALSLVPTLAMAGMGLVVLDARLALTGLGLWLMDVGIVLLMSVLAFAWKDRTVQHRPMLS